RLGGDEYARRRGVSDSNVNLRGGQEPYIAIDPAIEREVGIQRRDVGIVRVVDSDRDDVRPVVSHRIGDLEDESGVTTDVLSGVPAVDEDVGDLIGSFEVEEETLPA